MKVKVIPKRKDCAARARRGDCEGGGPSRFKFKLAFSKEDTGKVAKIIFNVLGMHMLNLDICWPSVGNRAEKGKISCSKYQVEKISCRKSRKNFVPKNIMQEEILQKNTLQKKI